MHLLKANISIEPNKHRTNTRNKKIHCTNTENQNKQSRAKTTKSQNEKRPKIYENHLGN